MNCRNGSCTSIECSFLWASSSTSIKRDDLVIVEAKGWSMGTSPSGVAHCPSVIVETPLPWPVWLGPRIITDSHELVVTCCGNGWYRSWSERMQEAVVYLGA